MNYTYALHDAEMKIFMYSPQERDTEYTNKVIPRNLNDYSTAYVYYDENTIHKILENKTLWFKHISKFSDIYENVSFWSKFTQMIGREEKEKYKYSERFINLYEEVIDTLRNSKVVNMPYYVLCASYKEDNWACWNIFTKKDKEYGAALSFGKSRMVNRFYERVYFNCGFVFYDDNKKKETFNGILKEFYDSWNKSMESDRDNRLKEWITDIIMKASVMFKSSFYESEKEIRFVINENYKNLIKKDKMIEKDEKENVYKVRVSDDFFRSLYYTSNRQKACFNAAISKLKIDIIPFPSQIITAELFK